MLALWFDFWNTASWTPAPPPVPQGVPSNAGSGQGRYETAGDHYWEVRREFLERHAPVHHRQTDVPAVRALVAKHDAIVDKLPLALTPVNIDALESLLNGLTLQIKQLRVKSDNEALLVLLL